MSATGAEPYFINSITIEHVSVGANCGEPARIDRAEDAKYIFSFTSGSEATYVLEPALEVNPAAGRDVPFTFVLMPKGFDATTCEDVHVSINYHNSKGDVGKLSLNDLSMDMVLLAKLLESDVRAYGFVATPNGLQRGDAAKHGSLSYELVDFRQVLRLLGPSKSSSEQEIKRVAPISFSRERDALHLLIERKGGLNKVFGIEKDTGLSQMFSRLCAEQNVPASVVLTLVLDICSTLPGRDCDLAFEEIGTWRATDDGESDGNFDDRIENSMAISHLFRPSARLASFVIGVRSLDSEMNTSISISRLHDADPASLALALFPVGRWAEALIKLAAAKRGDAISGLYLRREELTLSQRKIVEDLAWKNLDEIMPQEDAVRYLLWRRGSKEEIKRRLVMTGPLGFVKRENGLKLVDELLQDDKPSGEGKAKNKP